LERAYDDWHAHGIRAPSLVVIAGGSSVAGSGYEIPAEDGHGGLRASHADRERVIDTLKAAYVYGLVTKPEFDARVTQTLAARTHGELATITADIPAGLLPAPPPPRRAPAAASPPARARLRPGPRAVVATATLAGLLFFLAFCAGASMLWPLFAGAVGSALVSLCLAGAQMSGAQAEARPGRHQLPPQQGGHSDPGAGSRAVPVAAEELPDPSKPRRPGNTEAARHPSLRPQLSG
jgi:hypothetical protein